MLHEVRQALGLAALLALGITVAGCGSAATPGGAASSPPATASPLPTPTSVSADTPASALAPASSPPHRCHTADVAVRFLPAQGATGHSFRSGTLQNRGGGTCTVYGYVGMLMLDAAGRPLATVVQRGGGVLGTPTPRLVSLAPAAIAYFELEYTAIQAGPSPCPAAAAAAVTPPDETDHVVVRVALQPCADGRLVITALHSGPPRA